MQTKKLIGPVAMGYTQAYGVFHYLDNSLLDDYSFHVKKLHHRTISHLFARVDDIRGPKDNMCAAKKNQMKFGARFPESILSCQHSKKYQKTQKESS
jgi:hypothetical protein